MKNKRVLTAILSATIATVIITGACISASAVTCNDCGSNSASYEKVLTADMANPWSDCNNDMKKAEKISGLRFNIPDIQNYNIRAMKDMIEVAMKTNDDNVMYFRKGLSQSEISGIYGDYEYMCINDARIPDISAIVTVVENGRICAVDWQENGYRYSISYDKGMSEDEVITRIAEISNKNADKTCGDLTYTAINDARVAKYDVVVGMKDGVIYEAEWNTGSAVYHQGATVEEVVKDVLTYSN